MPQRLGVGNLPPQELSLLRPIASGQHPSAVAKHDQPTGILLDTRLVD